MKVGYFCDFSLFFSFSLQPVVVEWWRQDSRWKGDRVDRRLVKRVHRTWVVKVPVNDGNAPSASNVVVFYE